MATELTPEQESLYAQVEEIAKYDALSLRAMALWAHEHVKDKDAMRIASFVWQRNARYMARAVEWFDGFFKDDPDPEVIPTTTDDYLSLFTIATLPKERAEQLAEEWVMKTLQLWQVIERVKTMKQRTKQDKPPKVCPHCGEELK